MDTVGVGQTLHPYHTTSRFSTELLLPSEVVCSLSIQQTTASVPARTQKTEPLKTIERKEPRETVAFRCRSAVRKDWPVSRRSHPGKDRSPSCEQTLQDAATTRRLSPHSLFGAQFTTINVSSLLCHDSEPVLSVSPTLVLSMKARTWFLLSTFNPSDASQSCDYKAPITDFSERQTHLQLSIQQAAHS